MALSEKTGMRWTNIQRYETGLRHLKLHHLDVFARALECMPEDLLSTAPVLDEQQRALLALFGQLPSADQERLLKIGRTLLPDKAITGADQAERKAS